MTAAVRIFAEVDPRIVHEIVKLTQAKLPPPGAPRDEVVTACASIGNTILYAAARFMLGAEENLGITISRDEFTDAAAGAFEMAASDAKPGARS
jgi:hypothetical protein